MEEFAPLEEVEDEFALLDEEGDMIGDKEDMVGDEEVTKDRELHNYGYSHGYGYGYGGYDSDSNDYYGSGPVRRPAHNMPYYGY